jgi:pyridoxal phosphate enzyme (YggS family)
MNVLDNLKFINKRVKNLCASNNYTEPTIIVVSKTFDINYILPIINYGHKHFGENKVQESKLKWTSIIKKDFGIKLHMVGSLQSNKAAEAVNIFNYIHSLDNEKLANKLSLAEKNYNKKLEYFIQVNLSNELQKSGIREDDCLKFLMFCKNELNLNIIGLMCLPKAEEDPEINFQKLKKLANQLKLRELSMGMSHDFEKAIQFGSSYIRIGSAILGERN